MSKYTVEGRMIHDELKEKIVKWILENKNQWQIVNDCKENFRAYIFDINGNYLIGGENVYNFIVVICDLITGGKLNIDIEKAI